MHNRILFILCSVLLAGCSFAIDADAIRQGKYLRKAKDCPPEKALEEFTNHPKPRLSKTNTGYVDILYETDTEIYWGYLHLSDLLPFNHIVKNLYKTDKVRFDELKMKTNKPDTEPENEINEQNMNFERLHQIANADYGTGYTIGNYMLCPEKKIIRVKQMYGTQTADYTGYFPDSTLKYDQTTMIIFGGWTFLDRSGFNIDWKTVELVSFSDDYSTFTDGKTLYYFNHGAISTMGEKYDKDRHRSHIEKRLRYRENDELTEGFCVKGNTLCFDHIPILEPFDVPNLRRIVSKSGFETSYITDGKQVILGGGKTGYSSTEKDGKEYVVAEEWIVEGVDLPSLRVLGRELLADKNALYYCTHVIPFEKLNGFKFIIREL